MPTNYHWPLKVFHLPASLKHRTLCNLMQPDLLLQIFITFQVLSIFYFRLILLQAYPWL